MTTAPTRSMRTPIPFPFPVLGSLRSLARLLGTYLIEVSLRKQALPAF
jgi:hypothetical protein